MGNDDQSIKIISTRRIFSDTFFLHENFWYLSRYNVFLLRTFYLLILLYTFVLLNFILFMILII